MRPPCSWHAFAISSKCERKASRQFFADETKRTMLRARRVSLRTNVDNRNRVTRESTTRVFVRSANQMGRSVSINIATGLLTPQITEVDAERNRARCEREQISFDFAKLLTIDEALDRKLMNPCSSCLDDPASFERPLRVGNLLFELWTRAMLAAPSLRRTHRRKLGSTARPSKARKRGSMTSFETAG